MSTMKRCISLLLVLGILLSVLAPAAQATSVEDTAAVNTDNMTIEGTNGFGNLLSQEINQSQAEAEAEAEEYTGGYTVTDLEIENGVATVTYDSMEEATLVVALYTEDGMRMVTSAKTTVTPDATEATVTFESEMPEYFLASAYLLDSYDLSPLCAAYDTPMYTREMQELLTSTVDDYDPEKVLNLDEDENTNFAVYADTTVIVEPEDGVNTVASIDDENATYVIKNADETISSLSVGDVFAYPYETDELLLVKIGKITVSGTTVIIIGDELSLDEVFSHVKVENEADTYDVTVTDLDPNDGIDYEGLNEPDIQPDAWEGGAELGGSHYFGVEKTFKDKSENKEITIKGGLEAAFDLKVDFYISWSRRFVKVTLDTDVGFFLDVSGAISTDFNSFAEFKIGPVMGVTVIMKPKIDIEFSGALNFVAGLHLPLGFSYETDKGLRNLCSAPRIEPELNVEGSFFIGVDMNPSVTVISKYVASAEASVPVGVQIGAELTGTDFDEVLVGSDNVGPSIHSCKKCLDISVSIKAELEVKLKFLNNKHLTVEDKFEITPIKFPFYWSFTNSDHGSGGCPYEAYRVTVHVVDAEQSAVNNATVTANGETRQTNLWGNAYLYLPTGTYTVEATDGTLTKTKSIDLEEAEKVTIKLVEESEVTESDFEFGSILGTVEDEEIVDNTTSFEGHVYRVFDISATWTEAEEYCERYGGHLVTISSQEEMDVILDLLPNHPKLYYWIGLYRQSVDDAWEWVTDEIVTYMNWADGEPNDYSTDGENCAHLYTESSMFGQWNDEQGSAADLLLSNMGFICEWENSDHVPDYAGRYQIFHKSMTWNDAKAYCESVGGHLATITSAEEQGTIEYLNDNRSSLWIGGYRDDDFDWHWVTGEPWDYTNWESGEPNNYNNEENYAAMWPVYWNDLPGGNFVQEGFVCEFENADETTAYASSHPNYTPNAVYPGDYGTDITDTYTLKTASFKDLVPNEQYVLLAMVSIKVGDPLAADNLLFIDQAAAAEDGTLVFQYVQRTPCDVSYVVACGASHKDLNCAEITFPEMVADGELQVVEPVVVYDGEKLREGQDYVIVGKVDFTESGEFTCYIRGIHNYTGLVECTYRVKGAELENPFTDVTPGSYFYKPVLWALENGITSGVDATHFGSAVNCSRAQVVTFLYQAKGRPAINGIANPFTDVVKGSYYEKPVLWALENGVTSGMGNGTFGVNVTCTRAQIVTFLYKAFVG